MLDKRKKYAVCEGPCRQLFFYDGPGWRTVCDSCLAGHNPQTLDYQKMKRSIKYTLRYGLGPVGGN